LLYFFSGLAKLSTDWLAGVVFWHPRIAETGLPLAYAFIANHPQITVFVIFGAVLFQLFFPVFVWFPRFRYWMLGLAVVLHLATGIVWGKLTFNLLILILDLSFVPPVHIDLLLGELMPLLQRRPRPFSRGQ
jgi:hypothetical protein